MLKLPVKPPIVNENIDLSEYAKKSDVDAIGTSLGNKAEKKEVEKINSQLDTLTKKVDDEIKEIQSTTDTFKENINTSFNEFSNEQQNNFEALREEVLSDIEASYVGYDNEQHHNLESRLYSDFDKINQRFKDSSYLEYEGTSIKATNTYYGLTKEATVKGRTLQNIFDFRKVNGTNGLTHNNGDFSASGVSWDYYFKVSDIPLKPNTEYTVFIDYNKGTYTGAPEFRTTITNFLLPSPTTFQMEKTGIYRYKSTTASEIDLSSSLIYFKGTDPSSTEGTFSFRVMILEGDYTNTPIEELPFVEGIQGTGDTTKNLFKKEYIPTSISEITEYIPIDSSKTYIISNQISDYNHSNGAMGYLYTYNENKEVIISGGNYWGASFTGASFVRFRNGVNLKFYDTLQLEEGTTATPYEPYHTGYKVSGKSCGKNLVTELRKINTNNLKIDLARPIKNGESFQFSFKAEGITFTHLSIYCENSKTGVSDYHGVDINRLSGILTARNDYDYIKIYCTQNPEVENFKDLMVAITPTLLPYEPYQESTYSYILDEPLMQLPNGVADSIDLETGVLTRRVGKIVLDGSELWGGGSTGEHGFYTQADSIKRENSYLGTMYCSTLPIVDKHPYTIGSVGVSGYSNKDTFPNQNWVYLNNNFATMDNLKQWLKANPTTVYYELAEPTTEQLEPTQLKSFEGTTHIMSNNTLQARTSVKIPSNVQAVVTNLINENEALRSNVDILNVENEGLKETNEVQDELIDINMMATDEVYTMIEPLLASQPMSMERGMSKLVDMYVAMVQRGLKTTIDQVPIRYRAEVQAILEALEK